MGPGELPALVARALSELGVKPRQAEPLPSWFGSPRAFAIEREGGGRVKARVGRDSWRVARAVRLARELGEPAVVVPLGRFGRVAVEPWIEGTVLATSSMTPAPVVAAAELLARMHEHPGLTRERLPHSRSTARVRAAFDRNLVAVSSAGLIDANRATRLAALVERGLPERASWGLIHSDLCAENLLLRSDGVLMSIDNEGLGRGFRGYDLARRWYRWPLPDRLEAAFERGYSETAEPPGLAERAAWCALTGVEALELRARFGVSVAPAAHALGRLL